jgi:hypothetical protein
MSLVRTAAFAFLASAVAFAADTDWKQQSCRLALFRTPPSMARDTNSFGIDSIAEAYVSPTLSLTFDSEVRTAPATLQGRFDRTVAAWAAQRKQDWRKSNYIDDGGAIHANDDPKDSSGHRYYLYLGFAAGENGTFAIHVRFDSLNQLDDIERMLRSIKFKTQ